MFENEEWREVEEFPHYLISNYGRVKHVDRVEARRVTVNERGFPVVLLSSATTATRYMRQVNKLVADAFVPKPTMFEGSYHQAPMNCVWHIDGDLTNCNANNLMWETRARVLEWNEMHRSGKPQWKTPRVCNNRTGIVYDNAYECGMAEGETESKILWRIEKQARHEYDRAARYCYLRD